MADYVVRLTGKDELSGTLNKVKQELNQTGDAGSKLDQIRDRFNKIQTSSAPLKRKLREIQGIMAQMNMDGLNKSDVFTQMAAEAGAYKDAIGDAAQATRLLSSDTASLDALMGGLSAISSAASIATGVMGLFGSENENVQQAILKVQSALGILQGVQELSNVLNKDSILMLKLKQIWEARNVGITVADTAATGANTAATGLNTAANVASRLAQQAWNVVKAIGKALLGDFTGLLLVGAGALATYAIATSDSKDAQDKQNQSLKNLSDTYNNTYAQSLAQTEASYIKLKTQYANLKTEHEKIEWIKNNQSAFKELGLSVLDTVDADDVFINKTPNVIKALVDRAKAAADAAYYQDKYKKALANISKTKAGDEVTFKSPKQATEWVNGGYATVTHLPWGNKYHFTEKGAQRQRNTLGYNAGKEYQRNIASTIKEQDQAEKKLRNSTRSGRSGRHNNKGGSNNRGHNGGGSYNRGNSNNGNINNTPPPKPEVIPEGSIKDLQNKISKLKSKIEVTTDPNTLSNLQRQINAYQDKIKAIEIPVNLQEDVYKNGISTLGRLDNNPIKAPNITVKGSPLDKDWEEQMNKAEKIQENVQALEDLKDAFSDLGGTFGEIMPQWADLAILFEEGANSSDIAGNGLVTLGQSLQAIGGNGAVAKVGAVMAAIGQIILGFTAAAASPAVTSTGWGWLAFVGAGMAAVTTMISTIKGFSTGGIIQGGQIAGDQMLARVNAGEMILNGSQQKNLFNLLDSGGALAGNGNSKVEFKISGSSLKGVLRNYDSKMNKIR